jgi:hypothetical protein
MWGALPSWAIQTKPVAFVEVQDIMKCAIFELYLLSDSCWKDGQNLHVFIRKRVPLTLHSTIAHACDIIETRNDGNCRK